MANNKKKLQKDKKRKEQKRKEKLKFDSYIKESILKASSQEELEKAYDFIESEDYDKARKIFNKLRTIDIDQTEVFFGLGAVAISQRNFEEAIDYFQRTIEIDPDNEDAYFNIGAAYSQLLDIPNMIINYRKFLGINKTPNENVDNAKAILNNVEQDLIKTRGSNLDIFLKEYEIFQQAGDAMESKNWESAINTFKQLMIVNPKSVQVHGNMGICYSRLGKIEKALYHLDRALEIDPEYELALYNREIIKKLKEGECLDFKMETIDYYKEKSRKKN